MDLRIFNAPILGFRVLGFGFADSVTISVCEENVKRFLSQKRSIRIRINTNTGKRNTANCNIWKNIYLVNVPTNYSVCCCLSLFERRENRL